MKVAFLLVVVGLSLLGVLELRAQTYPYDYYWDGTQYQQYSPQEVDPYYQLHVMHYQLYRPQYRALPIYPPFYSPFYQPCCFVGNWVIRRPSVIVRPMQRAPLPAARKK